MAHMRQAVVTIEEPNGPKNVQNRSWRGNSN